MRTNTAALDTSLLFDYEIDNSSFHRVALFGTNLGTLSLLANRRDVSRAQVLVAPISQRSRKIRLYEINIFERKKADVNYVIKVDLAMITTRAFIYYYFDIYFDVCDIYCILLNILHVDIYFENLRQSSRDAS